MTPPDLEELAARVEGGRRTYAIADLHGRFDLLTAAYDAISVHSAGKPITIVHLGDYVDRGPQSREVIEWLMEDAALPPWVRRICLMGNHEDMMIETLSAPLDPSWWIGNGGAATLASYGGAVPEAHLAWARELPKIHVDKHRVFVHAGVDPTIPLDQQTDDILLWHRPPRGYAEGHGARHVVHGHTPNPDGPERYSGRTNLDTYAFKTGRLAVAVFDDEKAGGPVEILNINPSDPARALLAAALRAMKEEGR